MRRSDDPSHYRSAEIDEWHRHRYRLRGLHRIKLYDGSAIKAAKKRREKEAEEWIKKVRAR